MQNDTRKRFDNNFILTINDVSDEQQEHLKQIRQKAWANVKYRVECDAARGKMQNRNRNWLIDMGIGRNDLEDIVGVDSEKLRLFLKLFYPSDECVKLLMPRIVQVPVLRRWLSKNLDKVSVEQLENAIQNNVNGIFIIVHEAQVYFKRRLSYLPNSIQAIYLLKDVCLHLVSLQERQEQHDYITRVRRSITSIHELVKAIRGEYGYQFLLKTEQVEDETKYKLEDIVYIKNKDKTYRKEIRQLEFTNEEDRKEHMYKTGYCDMFVV